MNHRIKEYFSKILAIILCPSKWYESKLRKFLLKWKNCFLNIIRIILLELADKYYKWCYCDDPPTRNFINDRVDNTIEYFLDEESTITILVILNFLFLIILSVDLNCINNNYLEIVLKVATYTGTFVWLFYDISRKIFNIWTYEFLDYDLKTDPEDKKEAVSDNVKEILDTESEGYQEKKHGYFNHIEKVAQKIHSIYNIKNNSDINLNFFLAFAKDLKYEIEVVDDKDLYKWETKLNGIVLAGTDPKKRRIIIYQYQENDKKSALSLLHELGHVFFGFTSMPKKMISEEARVDRLNLYRLYLRTERDANYFAAAMLCCEYKFMEKLKVTKYDLIEMMRDKEYQGLSYETIAHRTATLSDLGFHAFKVYYNGSGNNGEIIKRFSDSGLDFNYFSKEHFLNSSAMKCFEEDKSFHIKDGIYTQISSINNKIGTPNDYFCFARKIRNRPGDRRKIAFVMGCPLENATDLIYYKMHQENH
ncbi:ImmA/IrrE family metallo-endopeptidase [Desulfobacula sp.]|uniref:ImmA/IrrE family metallo-endopeptidase n=1 Tax=Desulfobacula sp. TaxID=2593537 RepID=UPI00260D4F7B|nr:ImmA/IrrE family metallo-endopeptidase [Desulfobacula sp.]